MNRRAFIGTLAGGLLAAPLAAEAQQAGKVARVGVIVPVEPESPTEPHLAAFRQALRDLDYAEGQNIAVEYRYAHGKAERYAELASELVRLPVDVMVVGSWHPTLEAKKATQTIPIVGVGIGTDPVAVGIVASLARPGGNVTGLSYGTGREFWGKYVELLREAAPRTVRVAYLRDPRGLTQVPANARNSVFVQAAAHAAGLAFRMVEVPELQDADNILARLSRERGSSLVVEGSLFFMAHAGDITKMAAKYGLPAIYSLRVFMDAGGLMSYAPSLADMWRRAAIYLDKILKGAKPGDLPIEQPTKFELVINLKAAKALGLTIPQSLLQRAEQVID